MFDKIFDDVQINETECDPGHVFDEKAQRSFAQYIVYTIQGIFIVIGNVCLAWPMLYHKAMRTRKEYILVAALALMDTVHGAALIQAAYWRMDHMLDCSGGQQVPRWYCALQFSCMAWTFSGPAAGMLMCAQSLDRLFLVLSPLRHRSQGASYAYMLCVVAYVVATVMLVTNFFAVFSIPRDSPIYKTHLFCFGTLATTPTHNAVSNALRAITSTGSVVIFGLVLYLYKKHKARVSSNLMKNVSAQQAKREWHMTVSYGLSALFTLLFYVLPILIDGVMSNTKDAQAYKLNYGPFIWITVQMNMALNMLIYFGRHAEVRYGFMAAIKFHRLGVDVDNWVVTKATFVPKQQHSTKAPSQATSAIR